MPAPRRSHSGVSVGAWGADIPATSAEEEMDLEVGLDHKDADEQTFAQYIPHTFHDGAFLPHPDPVVETASLSSLAPPTSCHKLRLPANTITQGLLTNVQVQQ